MDEKTRDSKEIRGMPLDFEGVGRGGEQLLNSETAARTCAVVPEHNIACFAIAIHL